MIVEIATHGAKLRRRRARFIINTPEQNEQEIDAEKVDAIIITANAMISTAAVRLCLEKQIQLVVASWYGHPVARMWSSRPGRATELRRWQYSNQDTRIGMEISLDIVTKKVKSQKKFLVELKDNREKNVPDIDDAIRVFDDMLQKLKHGNGLTKDKLLGLEGYSAKQYFAAISAILPQKWKFQERSQHPATDEFNAALNYIYGMTYSSVEKVIILSGLDPNAGFYHADSYGKPTLSYDIIELVRPRVDKIIVSLFTKKMVRDDWFEKQEDGAVFLAQNGRSSILSKYSGSNVKLVEKDAWNYCKKITEMFRSEIQ